MLPDDQPPQTMPSNPNPTQTLPKSEAVNADKNVTTHRSLRLLSIPRCWHTIVSNLHGLQASRRGCCRNNTHQIVGSCIGSIMSCITTHTFYIRTTTNATTSGITGSVNGSPSLQWISILKHARIMRRLLQRREAMGKLPLGLCWQWNCQWPSCVCDCRRGRGKCFGCWSLRRGELGDY